LDFEPIHRIAFQLSFPVFKYEAETFFSVNEMEIVCKNEASKERNPSYQYIDMITSDNEYVMILKNPSHPLTVGSLQQLLDLISIKYGILLDYIHGEDEVHRLVHPDNIGFILPPVPKESFFHTIVTGGVLPRKTFSMGEAFEKRYYMESRKITL